MADVIVYPVPSAAMRVDFSADVLAPNMDAFAIPITVFPIMSQPTQPSYKARGIWAVKPVIIDTGTGQHVSHEYTLGIKMDEFPATTPPIKDDWLTIAGGPDGSNGTWTISEVHQDGQGGAALTLKNRSRFTG